MVVGVGGCKHGVPVRNAQFGLAWPFRVSVGTVTAIERGTAACQLHEGYVDKPHAKAAPLKPSRATDMSTLMTYTSSALYTQQLSHFESESSAGWSIGKGSACCIIKVHGTLLATFCNFSAPRHHGIIPKYTVYGCDSDRSPITSARLPNLPKVCPTDPRPFSESFRPPATASQNSNSSQRYRMLADAPEPYLDSYGRTSRAY